MAYGGTLTVPTVTGSHSSFAAVIVCNGTRNDLPADAYNSANAIDNGGGNLRAYTDSTKTTRLAVQVVRFVTGATPDIEVHVSVPTYQTSSTIYIEADAVAVAQPAVTDTYGRNNVWSDYQVVMHLDDLTDSTGNTTPTQANTASGAAGQLGDGYSFNGASSRIDATFSPVSTYDFMLQAWGQHGNTTGDGECLVSVADKDSTNKQYRLTESGDGTFQFSVFDGSSSGPSLPDIPSGLTMYSAVSVSQTERTFYRNDGTTSATATNSVNVTGLDRLTIGTTADSTPFGWWGGMADEVRLRFSVPADVANWIAAEHANQSATTAYFTNDGWADAGGGSPVTPAAATNTPLSGQGFSTSFAKTVGQAAATAAAFTGGDLTVTAGVSTEVTPAPATYAAHIGRSVGTSFAKAVQMHAATYSSYTPLTLSLALAVVLSQAAASLAGFTGQALTVIKAFSTSQAAAVYAAFARRTFVAEYAGKAAAVVRRAAINLRTGIGL